MIKFINNSHKIIEEMLLGYQYACADFIDIVANGRGVVRRHKKDKVAVVIGGGSGNEPWCLGFVGHGLADGAAIGDVYAAPPARAILTVTDQVFHERGVVYIANNHAGDVLNFGLVSELAELSKIQSKCIFVADDIATAPRENKEERRGIAGICLVVKMVGAATELGLSLEEVAAVAGKTNENLHTLSVTSSPGYLPMDGTPMFDMAENHVGYGMGFNGEPGVRYCQFIDANQVIDDITELLLADLNDPQQEIAVLLNGFGFTSNLELCVLNKRLKENFNKAGIRVHDIKIENWFSPQGTGGFSVSILELDSELKKYYDFPAYSPFCNNMTRSGAYANVD